LQDDGVQARPERFEVVKQLGLPRGVPDHQQHQAELSGVLF
jgi:hypothetical protein